MMKFFSRIGEYKVFIYRMLLAFAFYQLARVLFFAYNYDLIGVESFGDFVTICINGIVFDTAAILYVNLLFIVLSIWPLFINTDGRYQKLLVWVYFITNLTAYATNFIDFIYFKFTLTRSTTAALESIKNESNTARIRLLGSFIVHYWHVFLLFILCALTWVWLYKRVKVLPKKYSNKKTYVASSLLVFIVTIALTVGGIRGDFRHSTRPINMVDANRHVKKTEYAKMILNTPFAVIRTVGKNAFKKSHTIPETVVDSLLHPIKQYKRQGANRPNVVIFIMESFAREYIGSFNKKSKIDNYEGYTPFIDSLSRHSLIFPNALGNGRKSIHAMSSVLAGIPSFRVAYTSSSYANVKIESLVSILNGMGYDTSFFHGAENGSMGFLGFANVLGFDHYYGKKEYNNDADFDGIWGIWDKPYLKYVAHELGKKSTPFMATIFSLSSHDPFALPSEDKDKYPKGSLPIHKCIGYSDNALREFMKIASKSAWFDNTIFVITGDHCNQTYYDEYKKSVNRLAVPILVYYPGGGDSYVGEDNRLAQQIDIYPTLVDMVDYDKSFRSWGRSLVGDSISKPYIMTHNGSSYLFLQDSLIYHIDDNKKEIGFYDIMDKGLEKRKRNLPNETKESIKLKAESFIQDYMNRIVEHHLSVDK